MNILDEEEEVLASIYPDEFKRSGSTFSISITLDAEVTIIAELPATYPDQPPMIRILGLEENERDFIMDRLSRTMNDLLGSQMIFSIVSQVIEDHEEYIAHQASIESTRIALEKARIEEAEMKKFRGTKVTRESFIQWKAGFDDDFLSRIRKRESGAVTGRMMFESDSTLVVSDHLDFDKS